MGVCLLHFCSIWYGLDWLNSSSYSDLQPRTYLYFQSRWKTLSPNNNNKKVGHKIQQLFFKIKENTFFPSLIYRTQLQLITFNIHSKIPLKNNLFKCSFKPSLASLFHSAEKFLRNQMPAEFLFLCADELSQLHNTSLLKEVLYKTLRFTFSICASWSSLSKNKCKIPLLLICRLRQLIIQRGCIVKIT